METGDEELRRNVLSRYISDKQIIEAFKNCQRLDIKTLAYSIVGLPFETPSKVLKTIKLNAQINPGAMIANIFTPYPYTKLYNVCLEEKFIDSSKLNYKDEVFIDQPKFPKEEVLFLATYFKFLVRLYQYTQKIPFLWSCWDKIILWRYLPKRIPIILMKTWEAVSNYLKDFLRKKTPSLYIFLRDRLRKIKR